jgi:hypothetical protein
LNSSRGYAIPWSCGDKQLALGQEQIDEDCQHIDLAAILGQTTQPGLLKTELLLDASEGMLSFGADVGLLQAEAVPAGAVSIRSCSLPSGVSGRARRLPGRIATLKSVVLPAISGLLAMPWYPASA